MALRLCPDFLRDFACKRADCRRSCCDGDWTVGLTREEYDADRSKELGKECRALAERGLRRNPKAAGDRDYAYCLMREDGFCVLLTEDKLCGWQKLRGECVGAACNDFPRAYCRFLDDEYAWPTMACEALAESLLAKTDSVRLVGESDPPRRRSFPVEIDQQGVDRRPLLRLYPELMRWGLALLQDRRFPLDDRFVLLANAMSLIDWMERSGRVNDLPRAMEKFLKAENLQQVVNRYDEYTIGPKAFLAVNVNAFVRFMALPRFREKARKVLEGLGIEVVETEDGRVQCGRKPVDSEVFLERKAKLLGFMRARETFLEHVVVCEYLRSMMPVTEPGVWGGFQLFSVYYALQKGILYGCFDSPPGDAETVDAIVLLHRMFIHNYEANERTLERLNEIQLTDLTSMVALAKG
jgi:lysine-N-methylase